ncbi:uncharacterized protein LOC124288374 [Haliotis rubra]|uniref:uncharacterized protein LOC124288374 n=1 Tax=Haliotis rubra TaxID=36100 RepID=UPI001EE502BE|nr:uncharacterized protein LOC124288374 [Haliotis rubra]
MTRVEISRAQISFLHSVNRILLATGGIPAGQTKPNSWRQNDVDSADTELAPGVLPVVLLVPVSPGSHFFVFWRSVSSHLIPRTEHTQHSVKDLLLDYYRSGVVNVTTGGRLGSARELYHALNMSRVPSQGVLEREGKKPFFFMKSLLKEDYRVCEVFHRVLSYEEDFRCNNVTDQLSEYICGRMKRNHPQHEAHLGDSTQAVDRFLPRA